MADRDSLVAAVARQGAAVRELKKNGGAAADITAAVVELNALKAQLNALAEPVGIVVNKKALEDLLLRKMFVVPSFEIYGGVGGFYDFGPPGAAVKTNLLNLWRRHFLLEDDVLEIECTNIMPEVVLKTSGHVDRFTDLMVKCTKSGECYRADKLVEDFIENLLAKNASALTSEEQEKHRLVATKAESLTPDEMHAVIQEYGIVSPGHGAVLSAPVPFNLMFQCHIGPEGHNVGYLRPETAQGIFLNFRRLLEYNAGKIPFGCAQIGNAFRNEIAPRGGLIRVREFQQAEIEWFVHPEDKSHAKFSQVASQRLTLFPKANQLTTGKTVVLTVREAVDQKLIANESLAYYLARTASFVAQLGIDMDRVRFRQHLDTEMAHYACDCWDLEIQLSTGWVECAGHADRSCYDLQVHAAKSKVEMVGTLKYDAPRAVDVVDIKVNKGKVGKAFKSDMVLVNKALEALRVDDAAALAFEATLAEAGTADLHVDGKSFTFARDMWSAAKVTKMVSEEKFVPSVIEPSFGVGRILTAVFEHTFYAREGDEKRGVMAFPAVIAPIKVAVLPLSNAKEFNPVVQDLERKLRAAGIQAKSDTSGVAIGRKYARADELGIPLGVTIDFETLQDHAVTVRERDSCAQIRVPLADVVNHLRSVVEGHATWETLTATYPVLEGKKE
ncbi:glycine-tRNA ligase [Aphanomyces invadans]|uniref:glycine--tRNA ligase n=1 Tax=Aphanomyces invadans TaxID=157072 RepID=A0A024TAP6_9STRA|nr:glycine-tRNA ligase [Aphanomyces invadans]ETV91118.1 glycine-tRNA ligase [Aphanomyces invadans]|eukprot:XP_008880245.1 glycine-tRNA ligase [Aphanomyces invadans]